jgi:hypothetical protein
MNAKRPCWSILTIPIAWRRLAERRERHESLFRVLSHNDIQHWADRFLTALEQAPTAPSQLEQMPAVGF